MEHQNAFGAKGRKQGSFSMTLCLVGIVRCCLKKKVCMRQRHLAHVRSQLAAAWQSQLVVTPPEQRQSQASGDLLYANR